MNSLFRITLTVAGMAIAMQAAAQITFYEGQGFEGRSFTAQKQVVNFVRHGFNDRASSVVVTKDRWEVCEDIRFGGQCVVLRPGQYPSLAAMGLNNQLSSVRPVKRNARIDDRRYAPAPVAAQVTFYEGQDFEGRSFTTQKQIVNFERHGFNDRASSVVVAGNRWEVCEDARFNGQCAVLRPGHYPSLAAMGLNNRVSSVRTVSFNARIDDRRYAPAPVADYDAHRRNGERPHESNIDERRHAPAPVAAHDFHRRNNERLYEANVTSVRAVVGTPEQHCWVEQEEIAQERRAVNIPGAIAGAVIGGILGHQIGDGRGQDIATAGGAVAGAAVGAYIGRDGNGQPVTRDVQRCESTPSQARPDYWDVTYTFRGQPHRMQMTAPPGPTVTVNDQGEPRA